MPKLAAKRDASMMASNADKFMATRRQLPLARGMLWRWVFGRLFSGPPDEDANERAIEQYRMAAADGGEGGVQVMMP